MELDPEHIIEGVARAFERAIAADPKLEQRLLERMAELRSELMIPGEAAKMIGCTTATLLRNWKVWGLEKSTAFGPTEPRFFRTQIMEASRDAAKLLRGRKKTPDNISTMPAQQRAA
jgi:hypothetical protein